MMTFDDGGGLNNPYTLQSAEFRKNVAGCVESSFSYTHCAFSYQMNQYLH